jgi:thiamine-phosphate pyrophosphorylase
MTVRLSRFYPILDVGLLVTRGVGVREFAVAMRDAGVTLLQYRNKTGGPRVILRDAAVIAEVLAGSCATLVMNDRADLAVLAEWDAVHVGQGDLLPENARRVVGTERIIGISTHKDEQVRTADASCADYIAVGPVFATGTKTDVEPAIGLEGVRRARALTAKPLVAIGGITRANARSVIDAGADSVAVISELLAVGEWPEKVAGDFLALLR